MEVMLGVKLAKDNVKMQAQVLRAMREASLKLVQMKQSHKMFSAVVRQQNKKLHLREWAALAKKKRALRKCSKVSYKIDRQRTLTKFIALWFRQLHQSLKNKHLKKL